MNILLLGAKGQLGHSFIQSQDLADLGTLVAASRDGRLADGRPCEAADLDRPDELHALLDRTRPGIIINAAAYTAVDLAEQDEATAMRVNADAVGLLGEWAARHQALVVNYSTDYVFDGTAVIPYAVDASTRPLSAYGRSKLAGERALRESGASHLLLRTSWVYAAHGHNFLRTILRLGAEREQLSVVADQHGAPTSTNLISRATVSALRQWQNTSEHARGHLEGTHHLTAGGITSWHGFATAIFERAYERGLLPRKPDVRAITTEQYPTPARRPAFSGMDCSGFQGLFGIFLPHWTAGLDDVMREIPLSGPLKQC